MFKKVKECTGSFSCRIKGALLSMTLVIVVAVVAIILLVE